MTVSPPTPDCPRAIVRSALLLYRSMARSGEVETTASSRAFQAALAALDGLAADLATWKRTASLAANDNARLRGRPPTDEEVWSLPDDKGETGLWTGADPRIITLRRERDEARADLEAAREALRAVREQQRQHALDPYVQQRMTDDNESYHDGYFNGRMGAVHDIDAALAAVPVAPPDGDTA